MDQNRPRSRQKNVVGSAKPVQRRGSGLGSGPVGSTGGHSGGFGGNGRKGPQRSGGSQKIYLIVAALVLLLGGGGGLSSLFGGDGNDAGYSDWSATDSASEYSSTAFSGGGSAKLDTTVAKEARDKYTEIKGDGKDTVTIMVYMCGTDLESKSGMATSDLKEMASATLSDNLNILVYTGGCKQWKNNVVSSQYNQIYKIENGGMVCLEDNMGSASLTKPATLTEFIKYCKNNYPANRNELILWDHGGGSLSGFGYDEKNSASGSMNLAGINTALKEAKMQFDFIGFDACLMATMENALMLTPYADYLIASEETEPGVGWYYTNWLSDFAKNTSMPTIEVGKKIVDDFVDVCAQKCVGQKTTLSVIDLAELQETSPKELTAFAKSTNQLIQEEQYKVVSDARYHTREFAQSSKIDQVDLIHFAQNLNTTEGEKLCSVLKRAVKYNRTSSNMTNANGISIYFPYQKVSKVDQAVNTYEQIGMDSEYARCIQEFASLEVGGQVSSGGTGTPVGSLLGNLLNGGSTSSCSGGSSELITQMLGNFLSGEVDNILSGGADFLSGRSLDEQAKVSYLSENYFDGEQLVWTYREDAYRLCLAQEQWELIQKLDLNVFYDDGSGYIDLGLDNMYEFDDSGNLLGRYDNTWLSINRQPVAYYHLDTVEEDGRYGINGYVPALLNGERVELILVFDSERPNGYIAGARTVYTQGETETVAKNLTEVVSGDSLDFICDYYSYGGVYQDSYLFGERIIVDDDLLIGDVDLGDAKTRVTYCLTDIYNRTYWTPVLPK